jgi:hypothetical protein
MTMNPFASRRRTSLGRSDSLPGVLRLLKSFYSRRNSAKRPASFAMFKCRASAVSSCRADWRPHIVERLSSLLPHFQILESRSERSRAGLSAFSRSPSTERPSFNASIAPSTGPTVERISCRRSGEPSATLSKLAQFHVNCSNNQSALDPQPQQRRMGKGHNIQARRPIAPPETSPGMKARIDWTRSRAAAH